MAVRGLRDADFGLVVLAAFWPAPTILEATHMSGSEDEMESSHAGTFGWSHQRLSVLCNAVRRP